MQKSFLINKSEILALIIFTTLILGLNHKAGEMAQTKIIQSK